MTPEQTELLLDFVRWCAWSQGAEPDFVGKWRFPPYQPDHGQDAMAFVTDTANRVLERIEQEPPQEAAAKEPAELA